MNSGMHFEKEITVLVDMDLDSLMLLLNKNSFVLNEEYDIKDIYMIKREIDLNANVLDILNNSVLIRNIITETKNIKQITYKYKECNKDGEIVKNGKVNCNVTSIDEAKNLLNAINYRELIRINDHIMVYSNKDTELAVQYVNNKHIYIEIEEDNEFTGRHYKTINEMIDDFNRYNIPIKNNNYFVKKAEIEFNEKYR